MLAVLLTGWGFSMLAVGWLGWQWGVKQAMILGALGTALMMFGLMLVLGIA